MEAQNCNNAKAPVNHYQIGDYVYELGITKRLSPPMYVESMLRDTLYLKIDPEQGDPYEIDLEDIVPIPLTKELLESLGAYGKRIVNTKDIIETIPGVISKYNLNDWVDIHKYKDKFIAKYHERDDEYLHVVYLRYVHELQHFYRMFGINKEVIL